MSFNPTQPKLYLQINEKGDVFYNGAQISNLDVLEEFFTSFSYLENNSLVSLFHGESCHVEYFDEPLVAQKIFRSRDNFYFTITHNTPFQFQVNTLSLDEWDRFHGYTDDKIPFVLSNNAQNDFFNLLDEYTDETITFDNKTIEVPNYWTSDTQPDNESFWTEKYKNNESKWDLGACSTVLKDNYPSLKLPISRIAVLGGGSGHDAAFLAEQGHHVTLFDFSPSAIELAKNKYSHIANLNFVLADAFKLGAEYHRNFDIAFEHTFYCAINPTKRNDVTHLWKTLTHETGQLMGIFFAMEKRSGPPFGGSEWELRQRLQKNWQAIKWIRSHNSDKSRWGKEFFVFARKK